MFSLIGRRVISSNYTSFYRNLISPSSGYLNNAHDKRNLFNLSAVQCHYFSAQFNNLTAPNRFNPIVAED